MLSTMTKIAALLTATAVLGVGGAAANELKFMTGPQGGFWVPLGGAMKDMWEKNIKGTSVQALPGAGVANARAIEEAKADIGLGNSISTVDALAGVAPFNKPHKNVCNLANLYPQYMHVVALADSGINTVADMKGKSLISLPRGNTSEASTAHILQVYGLKYSDLKVNFVSISDGVTQMQDGHGQAWMLAISIPAGGVMDLASGRDIKLLEIEEKFGELKKINSGYQLNTIPAGTYPKQTKDVKVAGFDAHVIVSCKLPEDVVYGMAKTLSENVATLASVGKAMASMTPQSMSTDIGVPFHPGAARFYKEKGITVK